MTKYVRVKVGKEKSRIRQLNLENLESFKAGCDYFGLTIEDLYILLHNKCNVDEYYENYKSFNYSWHQHRVAVAQKEGIQRSVDSLRDVMTSNLMKAQATPKLLAFFKKRWKDKIEEIMEREYK